MKAHGLALVIGLVALGCEATPPPVPPTPPVVPTALQPSGPLLTNVDETALDKTVQPCDDFYQFACGGWLKSTPIPKEESAWTRSFDIVQEKNEKVLREILEQLAQGQGPTQTPYAKQLGDYYAGCVDEATIEAADAAPLKPMLARIDALKNVKDLAIVLADLHGLGASPAFSFDSGQDFKNASEVVGQVSQAGLGLPDRDYYLKPDDKMKEVVTKYQAHIKAMLILSGEKDTVAEKHAVRIFAMEHALADASMSKTDQRDPQKINHRIERVGLEKAAPKFPWAVYFEKAGAPQVTAINVQQPDFVVRISELVVAPPCAEADPKKCKATGFPVDDWRAYLRFHYVEASARSLSKRFLDESFKFEQALTGVEQLPPRWKRCVRSTDAAIGEALGHAFVDKTLGQGGKEAVKRMVADIEDAMSKNLDKLAWMDAQTKAKAHEKLIQITNKIAYPDKWRSYDGLTIDKKDYFGNRTRAAEFETRRRLAKIGKPLDRTEWEMTPPTVNAYYEPSMNEIVFPAGILQPPFYANDATFATNCGAIGSVVGHELTHGFDDEGRQFDGKGNLANWWTPGSTAEFEKRTACMEKQFDSYVAVGDVHVQGKLTMGENIADLGGLKLALFAMRKELAERPIANSGAYSPDQQFFLGFGQAWCTNIREEVERMLAVTDPHSPPRFRVNGPLSNMPEFAAAFSCKPGSKMIRADRCEVW